MKLFDALPLRARLFLLISALVLGVLIISAVGFYVIEDYLEGMEVRLFLEQEAEHIRQRLDDQGVPVSIAPGVRAWRAGEAPPEVEGMETGTHAELVIDGRPHDVVAATWRGEPLYVAMPENEIERLEVRVFVFFSFWMVLLTAIAMFLAYRMSARLVGPVAELAERVETLSPTDRGVRLAPEFRGEEVERIARAFDRYLERIEGFVEREQSFTSATSHELRTPLAIISGAAEILSGTLPSDEAGKAQRKALERIQRAAAEMGEFIDALLAMARTENGDEYRAQTDVAEILRRACTEAREEAPEGIRIECQCDGGLPVAAPPALVQIVVSNLLRNALRHTRAGRVIIKCGRRQLSVSDEGEGMAPDVVERAFERHFSGSGGGAGIGLYLVKRICDQYGWKIRVDSAPGRGTTFTIRFHAP